MKILKNAAALAITVSMMLAAFAAVPVVGIDVPSPQTDTGTITVNTVYPHIYDFDLTVGNGGGLSAMNSQIDVDDGTMASVYTLEAQGWYVPGGNRVDVVNVWMWFDDGATLTDDSGSIGAPWGPNRGVQFTYDANAVPTFQITSLGYTEEWLLDDGVALSDFGSSGQMWWCNFTFIPMEQVWAASGGFTQLPGNIYGGGNETQRDADNADPRDALDDANTWDVKVIASDSTVLADSMPSFDEYGYYIFSAINTVGWIGGGDVTGNGPPSTPGVGLNPSAYDWVWSANIQYDLMVSIDADLAGVAVPANTIPVTAIYIVGGERALGTFSAAATDQYILGDQLANTGEQPVEFLRTTTTQSGAGDGTGGGFQVSWLCDIPGVPEDTYQATITYTLATDP
ncbi:MAG: hypothetical protein V1934_03855 [Methanobacteriota archaeon]